MATQEEIDAVKQPEMVIIDDVRYTPEDAKKLKAAKSAKSDDKASTPVTAPKTEDKK